MERSTFRRDTSSGTCSTVGAKLRMLLTPAETSRSAAAWAAPAVVATMPIEISRSFTSRSRSSASRARSYRRGFEGIEGAGRRSLPGWRVLSRTLPNGASEDFTRILGACERNHKRPLAPSKPLLDAVAPPHAERSRQGSLIDRRFGDHGPVEIYDGHAKLVPRVGLDHLVGDRPRVEQPSRVVAQMAARLRVEDDARGHQVGDSPGCSTLCRGAREASRKPTNITVTPIASVTEKAAPRPYRTSAVLPIATLVTPIAINALAPTRSFGGATPFLGREERPASPTPMTYAAVEYQIASERTELSLCHTSDPLGMSFRPNTRLLRSVLAAATQV